MDILTRSGIALVIILVGLGLYRFYKRRIMLRTRGLAAGLLPSRPGASLLVYFTTPTCIPCKTVQRPAIEQVKASLGGRLEVVEIDASKQPDVANRWGVLSVPTTFVVAPGGQVRYINHGVARAERLISQLQSASRKISTPSLFSPGCLRYSVQMGGMERTEWAHPEFWMGPLFLFRKKYLLYQNKFLLPGCPEHIPEHAYDKHTATL